MPRKNRYFFQIFGLTIRVVTGLIARILHPGLKEQFFPSKHAKFQLILLTRTLIFKRFFMTTFSLIYSSSKISEKFPIFAEQIAGLSGGYSGGSGAFLESPLTHRVPSEGIFEIHQVWRALEPKMLGVFYAPPGTGRQLFSR